MKTFFENNNISTIEILYNNAYIVEDMVVCGTRGWFFEEERSGQHDEKVFNYMTDRLTKAADLPDPVGKIIMESL